jgi:hypothetical protein
MYETLFIRLEGGGGGGGGGMKAMLSLVHIHACDVDARLLEVN